MSNLGTAPGTEANEVAHVGIGRAFVAAAALFAPTALDYHQRVRLALLTRNGCVQTGRLRTNLDAALQKLGRRIDYAVIDADALDEEDPRRAYGTPTVLVDDQDLFGVPAQQPARHAPT